MSSASVISICNRALLSVGARAQVSSLSEGSTESDACSALYTPTFEMLARSAHWNCLRNQATLSLLAAAAGTPENPQGTSLPLPPTPWLYSYSLPVDCLQMRFIVPSFPSTATGSAPISPAFLSAGTCLPGGGQIPYAVAYSTDPNNNPINVILTNQTQAQAVYTVNQSNPVIWDSMFQQAMVASLAAYLAPALSLNMQLMAMCQKTAQEIVTQARVADGNETYVTVNRMADWMVARGVSQFIEYGGGPGANYGSLVWPGGY